MPEEPEDYESEGDSLISEELDSLTCDAMNLALDNLAEGEGLWPTLFLLHEDGGREYFIFTDDNSDNCLEDARNSVKTLGKDSRCYALLYDSFFEENSMAGNAFVAEFGERGATSAFTVVMAYGNPGAGEDFWYDEPMAGDRIGLLF